MATLTTYIGTVSGVYKLGDGDVQPLGLDGERVWALHAWRTGLDADTLLAGTYGNGLFRSEDSGRTWSPVNAGLTASAFRVICPDPLRPGSILAGTEPARLYRSDDDGRSWQELAGITAIAGHEDWFLPYSPRAGAIRNVYASGDGQRLLASVEVGGLLDSRDAGVTWECVPVIEDDDIHHITGHPDDPDLLYASLGYASLRATPREVNGRRFGGVARSRDAGRTWVKLEHDYTRAALIPPARHDLLIAGPAPDVGENGRIVVSSDGGDTWQLASDGIETPMPDMVELFVAAPDDSIWAICSGGRLLRATAGEWHWESMVAEDAGVKVQSVAFVATG